MTFNITPIFVNPCRQFTPWSRSTSPKERQVKTSSRSSKLKSLAAALSPKKVRDRVVKRLSQKSKVPEAATPAAIQDVIEVCPNNDATRDADPEPIRETPESLNADELSNHFDVQPEMGVVVSAPVLAPTDHRRRRRLQPCAAKARQLALAAHAVPAFPVPDGFRGLIPKEMMTIAPEGVEPVQEMDCDAASDYVSSTLCDQVTIGPETTRSFKELLVIVEAAKDVVFPLEDNMDVISRVSAPEEPRSKPTPKGLKGATQAPNKQDVRANRRLSSAAFLSPPKSPSPHPSEAPSNASSNKSNESFRTAPTSPLRSAPGTPSSGMWKDSAKVTKKRVAQADKHKKRDPRASPCPSPSPAGPSRVRTRATAESPAPKKNLNKATPRISKQTANNSVSRSATSRPPRPRNQPTEPSNPVTNKVKATPPVDRSGPRPPQSETSAPPRPPRNTLRETKSRASRNTARGTAAEPKSRVPRDTQKPRATSPAVARKPNKPRVGDANGRERRSRA